MGHQKLLYLAEATGTTCAYIQETARSSTSMRSFGPASTMKTQQKNGNLFIRDVLVANVTGDNKLEVTVALANGHIMVFSANGETLWAENQEEPAILGISGNSLIVGFDDGFLRSFNITRNQMDAVQLSSGITALATRHDDGSLFAGTARGDLYSLSSTTYKSQSTQ